MGTYTVTEEKDRTVPEDTILRARLDGVNEKEIEWVKDGKQQSVTLLVWWFEILDDRNDGLWKGRKIKGECRAELTTHPRNLFRQWAEALLGRELPQGVGIDPEEDLVGLVCDISVKHREYQKDGEKRIAEEIDQVISVTGSDDDVPF